MNDATQQLLPLLETPEPARLGPQSRTGTLAADEIRQRAGELCAVAGLSDQSARLVQSLALLWHDHLDDSHAISQGIPSADGSYLHGIMHRREPDFGNAAYWFRQTGRHPIFPSLAVEAARWIDGSPFTQRLVADDEWNPFAMIDACEAVEVGSAEATDEDVLRAVQAAEFRLLLGHLARG